MCKKLWYWWNSVLAVLADLKFYILESKRIVFGNTMQTMHAMLKNWRRVITKGKTRFSQLNRICCIRPWNIFITIQDNFWGRWNILEYLFYFSFSMSAFKDLNFEDNFLHSLQELIIEKILGNGRMFYSFKVLLSRLFVAPLTSILWAQIK